MSYFQIEEGNNTDFRRRVISKKLTEQLSSVTDTPDSDLLEKAVMEFHIALPDPVNGHQGHSAGQVSFLVYQEQMGLISAFFNM